MSLYVRGNREMYYTKIVGYGNGKYKIITMKHGKKIKGLEKDDPLILDGIEIKTINDEKELTQEEREETLRISLSRSKNKIRDYALCNDFKYFVTLTFDPKKIDNTDIVLLNKKVGKWFNNFKYRHCKDMQYILIPEYHKDKRKIHYHGLFSDLPNNVLKFWKYNKKLGCNLYNFVNWEKSFGFTSIMPIKNKEATSNYITKYMTKQTIETFNTNRYLSSNGLKLPTVLREINTTVSGIKYDFENDFVLIANINSDEEFINTMYLMKEGFENEKNNFSNFSVYRAFSS